MVEATATFDDPRKPVDCGTNLDEIDYVHNKGSKVWIIGGAGTYVALGARLAAGKADAESVGWIVDVGSDFPASFISTLQSWDTRCLFREDTSRLTTRAWNGIDENEERAFSYLTPKRRLEGGSLPLSLLFSRTFHMVCSGTRCKEIVCSILNRRKQEAAAHNMIEHERPIFVWEPIPDLCQPSELDSFWEACSMVDVVSPNEEELAAYFSCHRMDDRLPGQNRTIVEEVMARGIGPERNGMLVVRAGKRGCTAFAHSFSIQLPPYYLPAGEGISNEKVVDPTGGGNTFLGALCKTLTGKTHPSMQLIAESILQSEGADKAMNQTKGRIASGLILANVAASFAIEQPGMPILTAEGGRDLWNQEAFEARVDSYVRRERKVIEEQIFR